MNQAVFQNLRILDMGWVWAGGVFGHTFKDMGAHVVKVETRRRLDPARLGRPIIGDKLDPEQAPMYHNVNRGKQSVSIDMTTPQGRELILNLAKISDMVVENMSPGAIARAGLAYTDFTKVNPQIIMVSYPFAGQTGPYTQLRGYGNPGGALVGLDSLGADPDGDEFCGYNQVIGDPSGGQYAVIAALAALRHRNKTGEGQYVDLSMIESVGTMLGEATMDYVMNGRTAQSRGNQHPYLAPHGIYPCEGDEQWISIAIETNEEWITLCEVMNRKDLATAPTLKNYAGRAQYRKEINSKISDWTRNQTKYQIMELLQSKGIAAMPCLNQEDRYFDPHSREREIYIEVDHPVLGKDPVYGIPYKLSETPGMVRGPAPLLGQHNDYVVQDLLGISSSEQARLVEERVLY
jgi:benzylsuccinate CoA-transferase BbsF subunit